MRKARIMKTGSSYQLLATVLINVCYRLYAAVRADQPRNERLTDSARVYAATNGAHAYQAMFERRLRRGQCHSVPCLGWKEFVPDYVGGFRENTQVCEDIDLTIASMLWQVFPAGKFSDWQPTFRQRRQDNERRARLCSMKLYDLAQCLKSARVSLPSWHQHFKPCPQGTTTYFALIDSSSRVVELVGIDDRERVASVRKWEVENGISFPAFNVLPLYEPRTIATKAEAAALRKEMASKSPPSSQDAADRIERLVASSGCLWRGNEASRIDKCLAAHASDLGEKLGSPPHDYIAISELLKRTTGLRRVAPPATPKVLNGPYR